MGLALQLNHQAEFALSVPSVGSNSLSLKVSSLLSFIPLGLVFLLDIYHSPLALPCLSILHCTRLSVAERHEQQ